MREASIAVVCGLAFARSASDRGLAGSKLKGLPLLARALDPGIGPPTGSGPPSVDEGEGSCGDAPDLWLELRAMLASFHGRPAGSRNGTVGERLAGVHPFSPLLYDLPAEIELRDRVLEEALALLRGAGGRRRESHGEESSCSKSPVTGAVSMAIRSLGDIYEALASGRPNQGERERRRAGRSRRKASGMYYTPDAIVKRIVSGTLGRLVGVKGLGVKDILNLRILDPAAGSGHFLIAAAEYLAQACVARLVREGKVADREPDRSRALGEYRKIVAGSCVYGVDIDPVAVELAKLSLWLFASDPGASLSATSRNVRCGNSLHRFDWAGEFPEVSGGFDAVIGNPPYVSFSGRQKPAGNRWMDRLYPDRERAGKQGARRAGKRAIKPAGWQTLHGLFMLKSMELAGPSGLVSMVVPDQVGHLRGYEPVRSGMLEAGRLLEVRYWGENIFEGVTSPVLTFIIRKRRRVPDAMASPDPEAAMIDRDGNETRFSPEPGGEWYTSPSRKVLLRVSRVHMTLSAFRDPGVHTGNIARKLVLSHPSSRAVPLLEGRQIHPFRCDEPRRWLDLSHRPKKDEYFRVSAEETYRDTDIVLRQTASRPVAARHIHRCHFRNSVLALKVPAGLSVEYLLGVLNSEAAAYLYRAMSFESRQRSFPQIKVGLLRSLPIPDPATAGNRSRVSDIENIVRRIEAINGHDEVPAGEVAEPAGQESGEIPRLMFRLDRLAWSLYGFREPPAAV
jgi:hypothetical protein